MNDVKSPNILYTSHAERNSKSINGLAEFKYSLLKENRNWVSHILNNNHYDHIPLITKPLRPAPFNKKIISTDHNIRIVSHPLNPLKAPQHIKKKKKTKTRSEKHKQKMKPRFQFVSIKSLPSFLPP